MNNLIIKLIISLVIFSSILFVDSHSIDKRSPSTEGVIIGPDTPVYYLEYPRDNYLKVNRYVNKFEASPSYNYYRNPENKSNGTFIPKVLVILDWDDLVENRTEQDILNEVLADWNRVDKYFEQLDNPKIKLAIAGVVIPTKSDTWNTTKISQSGDLSPDRHLYEIIWTISYLLPYCPNFMEKWLNDNADRFERFEYDFFIFKTNREWDRAWYLTYDTHMTDNRFSCDTKNSPNSRSLGRVVWKSRSYTKSFSFDAARTVAVMLGIYKMSDKDCVWEMISNPGLLEMYIFTWPECSKSAFRSMINNTRYTCLHQIPHDEDEDDYS